MRISHFNKPITAKSLNESLDKRFGQTVDVDKFSTDQLMDARNKLRTALHDIETNESFDAVGNTDYQKKNMFKKYDSSNNDFSGLRDPQNKHRLEKVMPPEQF